MDDRNVVDAMHRLELIRRMRIQTMLRGTDAHRGQGPILDYIETHPRCTQAEAAESLGVSHTTFLKWVKQRPVDVTISHKSMRS